MARKIVDLTVLEKKSKLFRDLHTIFTLYGENGLTVMEIYGHAKKLEFTGYNGYTPDSAIRKSISKWNLLSKKQNGSPRFHVVKESKNRKAVYFLAEDYTSFALYRITRRMAARKLLRFMKNKIGDMTMEEFLWKPSGPMATQICTDLARNNVVPPPRYS